jgi:hypothetical protein
MSFEKDGPFTSPQGGEPERRREERRTRRKAVVSENHPRRRRAIRVHQNPCFMCPAPFSGLHEDEGRLTPPQGGEPERRRDKRRTRRQAGATGDRTPAPPRAPNPSESMIHVPGTVWHGAEARPAPNATAGRCHGEPNPDAAAGSESIRTHDSCAWHRFWHRF